MMFKEQGNGYNERCLRDGYVKLLTFIYLFLPFLYLVKTLSQR